MQLFRAGVLAAVATWMAQFAWAQTPIENAPQATSPPLSPAYCKQSTMTADRFIHAIKAIIKHGDLTDIQFLGKTFETKFKTSTGWNEDSTPNPQTIYYSSNEIFGSPVDMEIDVWAKLMQEQMGMAELDIHDGRSPQAVYDVFSSCLHISANDFAKSIGRRFFPLLARLYPGQIIQGTLGTKAQGKGTTMLYVYVHYGVDSGLISSIQIVHWARFHSQSRAEFFPHSYITLIWATVTLALA